MTCSARDTRTCRVKLPGILHRTVSRYVRAGSTVTPRRTSLMGVPSYRLTTILMSRFMLDLQAVDKRNRDHSSTLGDLGSMQPVGNTWLSFQLVIGSMGSHMIGDFPTESSSIQQEHFGDSDADSPIVQGPQKGKLIRHRTDMRCT